MLDIRYVRSFLLSLHLVYHQVFWTQLHINKLQSSLRIFYCFLYIDKWLILRLHLRLAHSSNTQIVLSNHCTIQPDISCKNWCLFLLNHDYRFQLDKGWVPLNQLGSNSLKDTYSHFQELCLQGMGWLFGQDRHSQLCMEDILLVYLESNKLQHHTQHMKQVHYSYQDFHFQRYLVDKVSQMKNQEDSKFH